MADNPLVGVSGPSSYSKRTDVGTPEMKLGSIAYGEGKETQEILSAEPLAKTPGVTPSQAPTVPTQPMGPVVGLFDETQDRGEPITAGIDRGEGPGSAALAMQKVGVKTSDTLAKLIPFDTDGSITILYQQAVARGD
jgi:hypothetical protein